MGANAASAANAGAKIAIVMGSKSDWATMQFAAEVLTQLDVPFHVEVVSAHRTPDKLFSFAEQAAANGFDVIIAGAGGAAHLPGMLAAKTLVPVLGVPVQSAALSGVDSLYSIVQMPRGIPVGTLAIGKAGAANAGLLAMQILALHDAALAQRLADWRQAQTEDLGRMLRQAGEPLGIAVYPVGIDAEPEAVPYQNSVITAEIERWPETALTRELATHSAFVNRDIFPRLADRLTQKQLLDQLGLATAPWQLLASAAEWPQVFAALGELAIVKRRVGGYDGRGQWRLRPGQEAELPADAYGECIVEQGINFSGEVSLVGARGHDGRSVFYPLTHNLHEDGILRASVALPQPNPALQQQAEQMLAAILNELNYVGVMAMECFIVGDRLLINELAPRVHNSGHWTQNGASISQFELHLRAILGLPLPQPVVSTPSVMVNLIGTAVNEQWLSLPLVHLHWYEKEVRPGRKVGHLNLNDPSAADLRQALQALAPLLPGEYQSGLAWAQQKLA
ncbi:hypothetical protein OsI_15812 [Oryza sativa Indica Group]|uniref:phosphoribosylaminoimidazole carboxylase n=13 Tax=cellular organisms TaxID=131567 RepID=A2XT74_ORYSI|nr:hypothetical protein OsI_15812 [Oryza sativa Indica Group]